MIVARKRIRAAIVLMLGFIIIGSATELVLKYPIKEKHVIPTLIPVSDRFVIVNCEYPEHTKIWRWSAYQNFLVDIETGTATSIDSVNYRKNLPVVLKDQSILFTDYDDGQLNLRFLHPATKTQSSARIRYCASTIIDGKYLLGGNHIDGFWWIDLMGPTFAVVGAATNCDTQLQNIPGSDKFFTVEALVDAESQSQSAMLRVYQMTQGGPVMVTQWQVLPNHENQATCDGGICSVSLDQTSLLIRDSQTGTTRFCIPLIHPNDSSTQFPPQWRTQNELLLVRTSSDKVLTYNSRTGRIYPDAIAGGATIMAQNAHEYVARDNRKDLNGFVFRLHNQETHCIETELVLSQDVHAWTISNDRKQLVGLRSDCGVLILRKEDGSFIREVDIFQIPSIHTFLALLLLICIFFANTPFLHLEVKFRILFVAVAAMLYLRITHTGNIHNYDRLSWRIVGNIAVAAVAKLLMDAYARRHGVERQLVALSVSLVCIATALHSWHADYRTSVYLFHLSLWPLLAVPFLLLRAGIEGVWEFSSDSNPKFSIRHIMFSVGIIAVYCSYCFDGVIANKFKYNASRIIEELPMAIMHMLTAILVLNILSGNLRWKNLSAHTTILRIGCCYLFGCSVILIDSWRPDLREHFEQWVLATSVLAAVALFSTRVGNCGEAFLCCET